MVFFIGCLHLEIGISLLIKTGIWELAENDAEALVSSDYLH